MHRIIPLNTHPIDRSYKQILVGTDNINIFSKGQRLKHSGLFSI